VSLSTTLVIHADFSDFEFEILISYHTLTCLEYIAISEDFTFKVGISSSSFSIDRPPSSRLEIKHFGIDN